MVNAGNQGIVGDAVAGVMAKLKSGYFTDAFSEIERLSGATTDPDVLSRLAWAGLYAEMNLGIANVSGQRTPWLDRLTQSLMAHGTPPSRHLAILIGFAGSLESMGNRESGRGMIERALEMSRALEDPDAEACSLFEYAMFFLNSGADLPAALDHIDRATERFEPRSTSEIVHGIRLFSRAIKAVILIRLNRPQEAIEISSKLILDADHDAVLYESCCLSLTEAYAKLNRPAESDAYALKNIKLWKSLKIEKRVAVGLLLAGISALESGDADKAIRYFEERRTTWIPFGPHWDMIARAWMENGNPQEAATWKWPQ
ncbi:MAG: hypothetical protein A3G34_04980 [Candidatus Lindowbacteria bacterium RIFCSPLOWO2_12_FULL_62_27]|nr:MAG: hypothetical protein A3G34_04980 [Candidatus Lindowbacteria bacterium RIFCSPLOWO2_12_FULL_62_27]OGH62088.1 MAG: hypothetical protein A3I06_02525 [Candidatus Lindowbacteria bacterium RIFCSPLOWO2_02_FULL_62_12]